ncbi:MAG: lamin tail domain-containing protein [Bacteroidota bacterium]
MKILIIAFSLTVFSINSICAQAIINEVQTSNRSTLADEDGDYEDWIELYNSGSGVVDLYNYGLSDDPASPFKWRFPSVAIQPGSYLLVFASGKNRKPPANHWETAVFAQDTWQYFVGAEEPPPNWKAIDFDASTWPLGMGGIGYGDGDDSTVIAPVISVYMRKAFEVGDTSNITDCILSMDYDDGFVAYLNGHEIARANIAGVPPMYNETATIDHEALMYQGGVPEDYLVSKEILHGIILTGTNVLTIHTHNVSESSSDLSAIPFLSFGIRDNSTLFQPVPVWFSNNPIINLHTNFKLKHSGEPIQLTLPSGTIADSVAIPYTDLDHVLCRIPDASPGWCISTNATPGISNNSSTCFSGYAAKPVFGVAPGFYTSGLSVPVTNFQQGMEIHYTRNGNIPKITDPLYTEPITVDSTLVLRARCFSPSGMLPGQIATSSYIIGSKQYKIPVVTISTDSLNLWSYLNGIYVMGPNAEPAFPYFGANFWQPWEKECHIEYFTPMGSRKFELDAGLSIHGGYSRAFDQKSFNIKTHSYFDSSEIHYKLFGEKPYIDYKSFILRNSGNDWMITHFRDALMQRIMKNSNVDWMAYCPSVVFLNGRYWGIYNIRERNNKDFVQSNHGVDADSLDMIEGDGYPADGNADAFWQMYEFFHTHELSNPENYAIASSWWNVNNYADYFIAETYYVNDDWMGDWTNNIKLWRERKPLSKWNYILWDLDFGMGLYSPYTKDNLAIAMNPPVPSPHAEMFSRMLGNQGFRTYFVNRYADLINTIYLPARINIFVDQMRDSIQSEMPYAGQRWFGSTDILIWYDYLNSLSDFISNRPAYARQYINNDFNLQGQVPVTIDVQPLGAGHVKINSIIPRPLPWSGTYFNGNPVTITAIAKPGYAFQHWASNTYVTNDTNQTLTLNLDHYDTFRAVFSGSPQNAEITFSEINYHSDSTRNAGDWIELFNYGNTSLDLSDCHLADTVFYHDYTFATGTIIPANKRIVIVEDTALFHACYPGIPCLGPLGFGFSNKSENLSLLNLTRDTIISFRYADSFPWPEAADGYGRTLELRSSAANINDGGSWFAGCMGGSPGEAYSPCEEPIIFSEINYNSAGTADAGDWVELNNQGNSPVNISGWKFSDSDNLHLYTVPANTEILAGDYLVLYGDAGKFNAIFPSVTNKMGPFGFGLSGSGEAIRLFDNQGNLSYSVIYDDSPPWPAGADGLGYTLEILDANGIVCDGDNWFAGCLSGSPGEPYEGPCNTGINSHAGQSFLIFPNPASTQVFIRNKGNWHKTAIISLNNTLGTTIFEKQIDFAGGDTQRVMLPGLSEGIYILKINSAGSQPPEMIKIIISN